MGADLPSDRPARKATELVEGLWLTRDLEVFTYLKPAVFLTSKKESIIFCLGDGGSPTEILPGRLVPFCLAELSTHFGMKSPREPVTFFRVPGHEAVCDPG